MPESAVGDSGATRTLLTEDTDRSLTSSRMDLRDSGMEVLYAGGESGIVSSSARLGEIECLFVPGLKESLVSFSDFTCRGSTVVLTDSGGSITNPFNNKSINLTKDSNTWRILLSDVANYSHSESRIVQAYSVLATSESKLERYISLHERLCHLSPEALSSAIDGDSPLWIRSDLTAQEVRQMAKKHVCVPCMLSKRRRKSIASNLQDPEDFASGLNSKTALPGEIISIDPVGPISPKSKNGFTLMWIAIDVASTYQWVFFTDNKRAVTVVEILKMIMVELKFFEKKMKILRTDAEEIFNSSEVQTFLGQEGVRHQISVPYEHYQNRVERAIQHDVRSISAVMHSQQWLSASYWEYAARHFIHVSRYIPNSKTKKNTPSRLMGDSDLDLSVKFLYSFGDFVAVTIPDSNVRWKFDIRRDLGIYLGDADGTKRGSLILNPSTGSIQVRLDCIKLELTDQMLQKYYGNRLSMSDARPVLTKVADAMVDFESSQSEYDMKERESTTYATPIVATWDDLDTGLEKRTSDTSSYMKDKAVIPKPVVSEEHSSRVLRSSGRRVRFIDDDELEIELGHVHPFVRPKAYAFNAKVTVGKALSGSDSKEWIRALKIEMDQMINTKTLEPILSTSIPRGSIVINSTMVLVKKPDKYKARLCACGNELKGQIAETYSPTIGALTYATVHQIAVIDAMKVRIIDTVGAYLYQSYPDGEQPIYIRVSSKILQACGMKDGTYFRIRKYIYGLPDAGLAYYKAYSKVLRDGGYAKSKSDPCLFLKVDLVKKQRIYIWIHVDDTFVASTHDYLIDELEACIKDKFTVTVTNDVETYLGIHFERLPNGDVKLTQPRLLQSLLDEYEVELKNHRARKPMAPQRMEASKSKSVEPMEVSEYLHLEGALIYLTKSRPDIQTAVSFGATHSVNPSRGDFEELIHCLKYLEETKENGLIIKAGVPNRELILKCYVDASYLTHADSKSHQGYCLSFGDLGTFYSKSSKQQLVATSSTQSEIKALQSLVIEIIFIIELCKELGRPIRLPAIIFEDNAAVIALSREMTSRAKRCKHFLMTVSWIREQVEIGLIYMEKVPGKFNKADLLTKILTGVQFWTNAEELLGEKLDGVNVEYEK